MWLSRAPRLPGRCRPFLGRAHLGRAVRAPSIPTASSVRVRLFTEKPATESSPGFSKVRQADVSRENVDEVGSEVKEMKMKIGALESEIGALENKIGADEDELRDKVKALEEAPEEKKAALRESMKKIEEALTRLREDRDKAEAKLERMIASASSTRKSWNKEVEVLTPEEVLRQPVDGAGERRGSISPEFIDDGKNWLSTKAAEIAKNVDLVPTNQSRKPVFAVITTSRGGKTRAMNELERMLRVDHKVATIYITFNGEETSITKEEASNLQEALARRIVYALRKDRSLKFDSCGAKAGFVEAEIKKFEKVVLFVDELNKGFGVPGKMETGAEEAFAWLKNLFLTANRALVFSSHINDSRDQAMSDFGLSSASIRRAITIVPPRVADPTRAVSVLSKTGYVVTKELIAVCGRFIAQVTDIDAVAERANRCGARMPVEAFGSFAQACLDGIGNRLSDDVRYLSFVEDDRFTWTPLIIAHMLRTSYVLVADLFSGKYKDGSGDVWEHIVLLAILLRILARDFSVLMPVLELEKPVVVRSVPAEFTKADSLPDWLLKESAGNVVLAYPSNAAFEDYDILLVSERKVVAGWQCKTSRGYPKRPALPGVPSFIMNGSAAVLPQSVGNGWVAGSDEDVKTFLGRSLAPAMPNLWRAVL